MKITIPLLIMLFMITSISHAQLSTEDQKKHFATGLIISGATYAFVYSKTKNKYKAFFFSLGLSTLVGFTKEFYDSKKFDSKIDTSEVIATSIGGLTASLTLSLFVGKHKNQNNIALVN